MTDKTLAERQRDIAVEALRKIARTQCPFDAETGLSIAGSALQTIAALDAPPQPDLAEIGLVAWKECPSANATDCVMAAYAATKHGSE